MLANFNGNDSKCSKRRNFYSNKKFAPYKYPNTGPDGPEWFTCDLCKKTLHKYDRMLTIQERNVDFCPQCDKKLYKLLSAFPDIRKLCKNDIEDSDKHGVVTRFLR